MSSSARPVTDPNARRAKKSEYYIVDCDVHHTFKSIKELYPYFPSVYRERLEEFGVSQGGGPGYLNGGYRGRRDDSFPKEGPSGSDYDLLREQLLDEFDIDYAVLTGDNIAGLMAGPDPDFAAATARAFNEWTYETWMSRDDRFLGSIYVAPQDPHLAAQEIDRWSEHPRMVQAYAIAGARFLYGQRYYYPIYEACCRNGIPFAVHVTGEGSGINPPPTAAGYPTYYIEMRMLRSSIFQAHIVSMVTEGVFERFPDLKVNMIEGGTAWVPAMMWKFDQDWKALRDQTPWIKRRPSEYIKEHVRFTTQPLEEPENPKDILTIFDWMDGASTLMFSSDYPHWDFDSPERTFPKMPKDQLQRILAVNAAELYGLKLEGKGASETARSPRSPQTA